MARSSSVNFSAEMRKQVECAICLNTFTQPKRLSCGHIFCRECIDKLKAMAQDLDQNPHVPEDTCAGVPDNGDHRPATILCPACRKPTILPENGASDLQSAFYVQQIIDLCDSLVSTEQAESGAGQSEIREDSRSSNSLQSELDTRLKILKTQIKNVKDSLSGLESRENEIKRQGKAINEEIDSFVHRIMNTVEQYGKQLKESVNQLIQCKIRKLSIQKEDCEIALAQLLNSQDFACQPGTDKADVIEQLQLICKEVNVDAYYPEEEANIDFIVNESTLDKISLSAIGKVTTGEDIVRPPARSLPLQYTTPLQHAPQHRSLPQQHPPSLPQQPQQHSPVVQHRQMLRATVVRKDISVVKIPSSFDVLLDTATNDPLLCTLTLGNSGHTINCEVQQVRRGMYRMSYIPVACGIYYIQLEMERNDVVCNPNMLVVSPAFEIRLKESKRAATALHKPWGIGITHDNMIVVTTKDSTIWLLTMAWPHNKILQVGRRGTRQGEYLFPTGVAITPDNHILVVDADNHCLQRITSKGDPLERVGQRSAGAKDENELKYPYGVAVDKRGKVFITDTGNNRIQVLNPDLSLSHKFGEKGNGNGQFNCPVGIAVDQDGCVYVCDRDNARIQKFSNNGSYMCQFGQGALKIPFYVTVDCNNLVYVTDHKAREVVVFDVNGSCYASLQMLGEPRGITTDMHGKIYVSNFGRNGIMTF